MNVFDKQRDDLENELDELREKLLVADASYENAVTIAERDAADLECIRLRSEIRARRQLLRTSQQDSRGESAPTAPKGPGPSKKRAQSAGQ
jgi:hypothetical protein